MPFYENVFIARQDVSPPQVDALADAMTAVIAGLGGAVSKKEYWGLRNLSYRIKKNRKGHYVLLNIDAPSAAVHEMERQMRFNEDILRFMTVRVDELEEGPSMMMQKPPRDERGERGGRRGEGFGDGPRRGRSSRDDEGSDDGARRGRGPRDDQDAGGLE
ncbi:MAG: 30S ribosomal protein S6 [Proteobacteria bacterium]|nr:30S ribosomal protein S6 [Pseudomonadota bacterium]